MRRTKRAGVLALAVTLASAVTGCSGTARAPTGGSEPALARPGPYAVGATTLDLGSAGQYGERLATVFYPADASKMAGHARFSYQITAPLPQALVAIVPAKYDTTTTVGARVDAPGSPHGPFPSSCSVTASAPHASTTPTC